MLFHSAFFQISRFKSSDFPEATQLSKNALYNQLNPVSNLIPISHINPNARAQVWVNVSKVEAFIYTQYITTVSAQVHVHASVKTDIYSNIFLVLYQFDLALIELFKVLLVDT